jgi:hypothetical protein
MQIELGGSWGSIRNAEPDADWVNRGFRHFYDSQCQAVLHYITSARHRDPRMDTGPSAPRSYLWTSTCISDVWNTEAGSQPSRIAYCNSSP